MLHLFLCRLQEELVESRKVDVVTVKVHGLNKKQRIYSRTSTKKHRGLYITNRHQNLTDRNLCITNRHLYITDRHICIADRHLYMRDRHLYITDRKLYVMNRHIYNEQTLL